MHKSAKFLVTCDSHIKRVYKVIISKAQNL